MFFEKDQSRGIEGTFMWFMEEVGELASALRENNDPENLAEEFADVLAWLATMANVAGIDLEQAVTQKYVQGCPRCHQSVCTCDLARKPWNVNAITVKICGILIDTASLLNLDWSNAVKS